MDRNIQQLIIDYAKRGEGQFILKVLIGILRANNPEWVINNQDIALSCIDYVLEGCSHGYEIEDILANAEWLVQQIEENQIDLDFILNNQDELENIAYIADHPTDEENQIWKNSEDDFNAEMKSNYQQRLQDPAFVAEQYRGELVNEAARVAEAVLNKMPDQEAAYQIYKRVATWILSANTRLLEKFIAHVKQNGTIIVPVKSKGKKKKIRKL